MRLNRLKACFFGALAAAVATVSPTPAKAQQTLALNRFDPAPAGDRMFGAPSPFVAGHLVPHIMIMADYAHNPLVLRNENTNENVGAIVGDQLFLHLNASFALWHRINVNVDVPVAVAQSGESPTQVPGVTSPGGAQFGDLRFNLRLRLLGEYFDPIQLAIAGSVWVPTGPTPSFVSDGSVRGLPQAIIGGRADRLVWSFAVGPEIRPSSTFAGIDQGSMFKWTGGIGVLVDNKRHLQLGGEFSAGLTFDRVDKRTNNAEFLFNARYRIIDDLELGAAMGPGLSSGIGSPDFRGVWTVAYTPEQKQGPKDRDKDGILDAVDACPDVPGVANEDAMKHGCPLPKDTDGDGIIDDEDACPTVKGVKDEDPKKNGCPADRDGDGILDADDACPDVPGVKDEDPKKHGCPPDRDGDGIIDAKDACPDLKGIATDDPATNGCPGDSDGDTIRDDKDACPNERGAPDPDPTKHGCPKAVRVTAGEIVILQQVQFDTAKATIKKVSDALLDEVGGVLNEHKEILKIEVQGHTDTRGNPRENQRLSQARAESVMKALITRKVDAGRLTAKGFGQDTPIADNRTDEGRQKNRRVQFKILEKKPAEIDGGRK